MRPTDLKFRSPKERTGEFHNASITSNGSSLSISPVKIKPSFAKEPRFPQYEFNSKITGYRVGPGSYEVSPRWKRSGPVYRKFHAEKDLSNNGYYYIGHQIVFEATMVPRKKRHSMNESILRVDAGQVLPESLRPKTTISVERTNTRWWQKTCSDITQSTLRDESPKSPSSNEKEKKKAEIKRSCIKSPNFNSYLPRKKMFPMPN
ncbi:unnamed protein product [Blepharisma stoltei]|uniref:Uncharacterized protein n=1 Tax=Blepharisma stoltei TaxID=1481888 RepID=A0AAU9K848_9CILI|nr:unnamed protein product [Blepharisma stoltei]